MDTLRTRLTEVIDQAEAMTTRDDFAPDDPGYLALRDEAERLQASYREMASWAARRATSHEVGDALHRAESSRSAEVARTRAAEEAEDAGAMFVRSEVFRNYPGRGTSARLEIPLERALPHALADFSGVLPPAPQRDVTPPGPRYTITDLVPSIPVSSNSVDAVVWSKTAGGAADVAEGSDKPSSEFGVDVVTYNLVTIATWTQMTRQLLEDGPAVRARLNTLLAREVRIKSEANAAAAIAGATLPTATGADLLAAIRVGMGVVESEGFSPNAVLLNPADYAALDIDVFAKTLAGTSVNRSFWGLTPVSSAAQAAGTATVGDFNVGVERYVRNGINLYLTDSHASTFIANVFTLLAESRERTVVVRPDALVDCSVATPPA